MPKSKQVTVYPTGERLMPGVPDVPLTTDAATADRLVASGAFRYEAPEGETLEAIELSAEAAEALDLFMPTEPSPEPDDPAEAKAEE